MSTPQLQCQLIQPFAASRRQYQMRSAGGEFSRERPANARARASHQRPSSAPGINRAVTFFSHVMTSVSLMIASGDDQSAKGISAKVQSLLQAAEALTLLIFS